MPQIKRQNTFCVSQPEVRLSSTYIVCILEVSQTYRMFIFLIWYLYVLLIIKMKKICWQYFWPNCPALAAALLIKTEKHNHLFQIQKTLLILEGNRLFVLWDCSHFVVVVGDSILSCFWYSFSSQTTKIK